MKTLHTLTHTQAYIFALVKRYVICIALVNFFVLDEAASQSFCQGGSDDNSIGPLPGPAPAMSGSIYLKLYVHAIGKDNGDERPTTENINESLAILKEYFSPHGIFFVWDCYINPINSTSLYNAQTPVCTISTYASEADGINLFIGPDNAFALNFSPGVPSGYAFVKGSRDCEGITGSAYVSSRSTVIAHEMGHALGLWHTHHGRGVGEGGLCGQPDPDECAELVDDSNDQDCGDYVEDTRADPEIGECQPTVFSSCNFVTAAVDANDDPYDPDETLIMSYAHPKCHTRFTDGQGERMRRMISYAQILEDCIVQPDFAGHIISANTTWTTGNTPNGGEFLIEDDLIIEGGYVLDINAGVIVHFGEQSRLIVKPDALLILRGTLTGMGCNGFTWQGVKVWGSSPSSSQYVVSGHRAQGRMVCYGGLIEKATTAIELYGPTSSLAGGQLNASELTIKNCPIGIELAKYANSIHFLDLKTASREITFVQSVNRPFW